MNENLGRLAENPYCALTFFTMLSIIKVSRTRRGREKEKDMRLFEEGGYVARGNVLSKEDFIPCRGFAHTKLNPERMGVIIKEAENLLSEPLEVLPISRFRDFVIDGNRSRFERLYFKRRDRLVTLAYAEMFERKGRFTEALVDTVWAILEEDTWLLPAHNKHNPDQIDGLPLTYGNRRHGLAIFSSSNGSMLAFIYYMLKDAFDAISPEIGKRILYEVHERVVVPFLTLPHWWSGEAGGRPNNWNPWIVSEVVLATALVSEDMQEREAVLERAMRYSDNFVAGYGIDAGCDEGPAYWSGAGLAYFTLLCVVHDFTGGKIDLLSHPFVKKMGEYVAKVYIAGRYYVNNADCALRPGVGGSFMRLYGERVGSSVLTEMGLYTEEESPFMRHGGIVNPYRSYLSLCLPLPEGHTEIRSPLAVWFRDLKIALLRENPDAFQGICLVLKGGCNGESHNHNDVGQFYLYANGNPVIVDMGGMQYTRKTFSSERYTIMAMRSIYHSTITPGGVEQLPGDVYRSTDEVFDEDNRTVRMQLKEAYPNDAGILDLVREVKLEDGCAIVTDTVAFSEERSLDIHFLSAAEPVQNTDGTLTLAEGITLTYPATLTYRLQAIPMDDPNLQSNWKRPNLYMLHFETTTKNGVYSFKFCK